MKLSELSRHNRRYFMLNHIFNIVIKTTKTVLGCYFCIISLSTVYAQSTAPAGGQILPIGASAKKVDEFLATLRPPTSFKALLNGNDLLLDVPDIARAGPVRVKAISTIARTDAMWLLTLHPMPDSGSAMFVGTQFNVAALPEMTLTLQLYKTQPVLLVARAGGKYYGFNKEVKVGQASLPGAGK
jgi:hypothetical protein